MSAQTPSGNVRHTPTPANLPTPLRALWRAPATRAKAKCAVVFAAGTWAMAASALLSAPSNVVRSFLLPSVLGCAVIFFAKVIIGELRQTGIHRPDAASILARIFGLLGIAWPLLQLMKSATWPVTWKAMLGAGLLLTALLMLLDILKAPVVNQGDR